MSTKPVCDQKVILHCIEVTWSRSNIWPWRWVGLFEMSQVCKVSKNFMLSLEVMSTLMLRSPITMKDELIEFKKMKSRKSSRNNSEQWPGDGSNNQRTNRNDNALKWTERRRVLGFRVHKGLYKKTNTTTMTRKSRFLIKLKGSRGNWMKQTITVSLSDVSLSQSQYMKVFSINAPLFMIGWQFTAPKKSDQDLRRHPHRAKVRLRELSA